MPSDSANAAASAANFLIVFFIERLQLGGATEVAVLPRKTRSGLPEGDSWNVPQEIQNLSSLLSYWLPYTHHKNCQVARTPPASSVFQGLI